MSIQVMTWLQCLRERYPDHEVVTIEFGARPMRRAGKSDGFMPWMQCPLSRGPGDQWHRPIEEPNARAVARAAALDEAAHYTGDWVVILRERQL